MSEVAKRKFKLAVSVSLVILQIFQSAAFAGFLYLPFSKSYSPTQYVYDSYSLSKGLPTYKDPKTGKPHTGTDYRGDGYGTPVYAAYDGTVVATRETENDRCDITLAQQLRYGNYVKIDHQVGSSRYRTEYWHLKQNGVVVVKNQQVKTGDLIAYVSNSGITAGSDCAKRSDLPNGAYYHLHFEVKIWNGSKWVVLNPYAGGSGWLWTTNPPTSATQANAAPYIIKTSTSGVWLVLGGKKYPISDFDTIAVLGFRYPQDVRVVSSTEFNSYPNGPLIPYIKDYWIAQYYPNKSWSGPFKAVGSFSALTSLRWGSGSPDPAIPADDFSAIFSRKVELVAGTYDFVVGVDDGASVYLDGVLIGSVGQGHWNGSFSRAVSVGWHLLQVKYWEGPGLTYLNFSYMLRDNSGPQVSASIGVESQNGWFDGDVPVIITATDPSGVAKIAHRVNGGDWIQTTGSSITPILGAEGVNTLSFKALDNRGNWSTEKSEIIPIDFTPPTTELFADGPVYESEEGKIFISPETSFDLYADDANQDSEIETSGVSQTTLSIDGGETQIYEGEFSLSGSDGQRVIGYASSDLAGNVESPNSQEVFLDSAAPASSDDSDGEWHNEDVLITITSDDGEGSGVKEIHYGGSQEGVGESDQVEITFTDEGIHNLSYFAVDNVENVEEEKIAEPIKIDKTAPKTIAEIDPEKPESGWYRSDVEVTLEVTDENLNNPEVETSGIRQTNVTITNENGVAEDGSYGEWDISLPFEEDGIYAIEFNSEDWAGNVEEPQNLEIKRDATSPTSTIVSLEEGAYYNANTWPGVLGTADDNLSGIFKVEVEVEGVEMGEAELDNPWALGTGWSYPLDFAEDGSDDGGYTVSSRATDQAGNQEPFPDDDSILIYRNNPVSFVYDSIAPVTSAALSGTKGLNDWYVSPVTFSLAVEDINPFETYYLINGFDRQVYTGLLRFSDGVYTLEFWSVDRAGNEENHQTLFLKIDTVAPFSPVSSIAGGSFFDGEKFSVILNGGEGYQIYYAIDGLNPVIYIEPFLVSGDAVVSAYAVDEAGNQSPSVFWEFSFGPRPILLPQVLGAVVEDLGPMGQAIPPALEEDGMGAATADGTKFPTPSLVGLGAILIVFMLIRRLRWGLR